MIGVLYAVLGWLVYTALFWLVLALCNGDFNWFQVAMDTWSVGDRAGTLFVYVVMVPGIALLCVAGAG